MVDGCFFFLIVANEFIYCVAQSYIMLGRKINKNHLVNAKTATTLH